MSPKRGGGKKRSKPITSEGTTTSEAVTMTTVNVEEMRDNIKCLSEENEKLRKEQLEIQAQNKLILEELDKLNFLWLEKDKSIELLENKLKESNDVTEQQQLDLANLKSKYDTLMDQNKVLEETLVNKETTIREQRDVIDYQQKELLEQQNASEVQQKSIKDYRESIFQLREQLGEMNKEVATLEAKVQKAVSNSEEAATSLLEKENQISCMVTRNREAATSLLEKDDKIACMVTEMNHKVSKLESQIQEGVIRNREATTSLLEKDEEISILNSNIVNATRTTKNELARMVTCHAIENALAADEFHAYKTNTDNKISEMEESIIFVDSKNRVLQFIINKALLSLQSFHADLQAQPRSCFPCLPRKIKTRDVIERISNMCNTLSVHGTLLKQ